MIYNAVIGDLKKKNLPYLMYLKQLVLLLMPVLLFPSLLRTIVVLKQRLLRLT